MAQRKTVFVTGAGSGIGRAIAHKYAREGWFVGLGDRSREGMEETVAGMPGGYSYSHVFDVSDRAARATTRSASSHAARSDTSNTWE